MRVLVKLVVLNTVYIFLAYFISSIVYYMRFVRLMLIDFYKSNLATSVSPQLSLSTTPPKPQLGSGDHKSNPNFLHALYSPFENFTPQIKALIIQSFGW